MNERRRFLAATTAAGLACPWRLAGAAAAPHPVTEAPPAGARDDLAHPYLGAHQAGVVTPRPAAGLVAAFDVLAADRAGLASLLRVLTERIAFLTQGGPVPTLAAAFPPPDSGLLGDTIKPDSLTITVSVGASLFDDRYGLAHLKPRRLSRMTRFPNDALDADLCHGDLAVQICANTPDTVLHALRDIIKHLPGALALRWKQEGNVPHRQAPPGAMAENARNFLGFRDGSANPDAADDGAMRKLVWIAGDRDEPAWAHGGTYQAVRIIRNFVERWDRTPLREQEAIIGRRKYSGAPLDGGATEFDVPDLASDPLGRATPMDAHIRLANPRTLAAQANLMLRRPYNYSNGVTRSGQLDMGLLFIAYQADLEQGFIAVQRRLDGEPLEEYIKPVGGGYFFVLPGIPSADDYLGRALLDASAS